MDDPGSSRRVRGILAHLIHLHSVSVNSKTGAVTLRVATTPKTSQRGSVRLFSKDSFSGGGLFIVSYSSLVLFCLVAEENEGDGLGEGGAVRVRPC